MGIRGFLVAWFASLAAAVAGRSTREREVHAFYYLWYGNPETDGQFRHWDHEVLPHWTAAVNRQYAEVGLYFDPANDNLHAPYYPALGAYSSRDPVVIRQHFSDMQRANVDVIAVSWWGQAHKEESTDNQGVSTDLTVALLLELADETVGGSDDVGISVCFHLEPYPGRTARSVLEDIKYIHEKYGHHHSLARNKVDNRVIFYVYDSYHISVTDWAEVFSDSGKMSIRSGGPYQHLDSFMLGLWLDSSHGQDLASGGFDGFYTYFASDGFSYGSTSRNWRRMCDFARKNGLTCDLSVGPGYQDDKIRPWNGHNTKPREDGEYYDAMWKRAIEAGAEIVSITSFNEWGEGTQIEPVSSAPPRPESVPVIQAEISPRTGANCDTRSEKPSPREYLTYEGLGSYGYIDRTKSWAQKFRNSFT